MFPFTNEKNILCIGGRLKNANVNFDAKYQVILSRHHLLGKLVISDIHYKNAYIRKKQTLCLLRNKYCIPAFGGVIRNILSNCFHCKRVNLTPKVQVMANIPQGSLLIYDYLFASTEVFWTISSERQPGKIKHLQSDTV